MKKKMLMNRNYADIVWLSLLMITVYAVIWHFNGCYPWVKNVYNSYSLQASRWLHGNLDLGQNYSHLEIAVFGGNYFVSFPPFPSVVLLPFVLLFGTDTPDHLLCALSGVIGAVFLMKTAQNAGYGRCSSILFALCATVCGNFLFVSSNGGVWFLAQTFAFALSSSALWCLCCAKAKSAAAWGLFLWACAVGCRPLNAIYAPLLCFLIWQRHIAPHRAEGKNIWRRMILSCIPAVLVAVFYMTLNFARFGNVTEFGHNYLPEFTESEYGQFSLRYMAENLGRLFRLPTWENGKIVFPHFDGVAFWLVSPLFLMFAGALCRALYKRPGEVPLALAGITVLLVALHLLLFTMHKTMGGWHFGNRYTVDCIPFLCPAFLALPRKKSIGAAAAIWSVFTLILNIIGTAEIYLA